MNKMRLTVYDGNGATRPGDP